MLAVGLLVFANGFIVGNENTRRRHDLAES